MAEKASDSPGAGADAEARPWQSYHTVFTNAKAGMEGVDKEKVQRVVYEMSKGSKYFENQERKEAETRQKIERMRSQREKLSAAELAHHQMIADKRLVEVEATRDLTKTWLHVDMDAFYAAVETLSDPSLKGKPMAVGSISMISTANYEARRFGVRAAMPGFIARKLCPGLIFVPTDFKKYTHYSDLTRKVFQKYDPNFLAASLDEAYLDITVACKERNMPGEEIAEELRAAVFEETSGLTCSAGVAPNRLLAKVCSDINKPNGQFILPKDRTAVMTFISSLPIRKIGGIGKVTEDILRDVFGIKTCEDMLQKSGYLYAFFSRPTADFFLSVGLGLGKTDTPELGMRKSISNERTFSATGDEALLYQRLAKLAEMLSIDMNKEGLHGRTLTLKLKTAAFEVRTRAITLERYICSSEDIMKHASKLLKAELPASLRLIGLRLSHFKEDKLGAPIDPTQKTLRSFIKEGSSLCSDPNDRCFMDDVVTNFSIDSHEINPHGLGSRSGVIDASDTSDKNCTSHSAAGIGLTDHKHEESNTSKSLREVGGSRSLGEAKQRYNDEEPSSSSHQEEQFLWQNDYKCSLCGIELPPSFTEERQEHYDYHLAEKLQKEESSSTPRIHTPKQRSAPRDQNATTSRPSSKKRKTSPKGGGHLPIHLFFGKTNQNF